MGQKKKIIMKRISKPIPELVPHQNFWRSEQVRKARSAKASHRTAYAHSGGKILDPGVANLDCLGLRRIERCCISFFTTASTTALDPRRDKDQHLLSPAFRYDQLGSTYYGSLAAQRQKRPTGHSRAMCVGSCGEHPKPPRGQRRRNGAAGPGVAAPGKATDGPRFAHDADSAILTGCPEAVFRWSNAA